MQATVFFGREPVLGIKVVLKQYRKDLRGIYREIKIFTELERLKNKKRKNCIVTILEEGPVVQQTLPNLLSYSIGWNN